MMKEEVLNFDIVKSYNQHKVTFRLPSGKTVVFYKGMPERNIAVDMRDKLYLLRRPEIEQVIKYKKQSVEVWAPKTVVDSFKDTMSGILKSSFSEKERIVKAMEQLKKEKNKDNFTKDGKPSTSSLGEIVGFEVSAKLRDKLWEKVSD